MTDLTKLHADVCFGRAGGRIIWQPRILCWWHDREFAGQPRPAPYDEMTYVEMYRSLGCSNRIYEFNACFRRIEDPRVHVTERTLNEFDTEISCETPVGTQTEIHHRSPHHRSTHIDKWPIRTPDDFRIATWREERAEWAFDQATFDQLLAEWAGLGAPTMYMPRTTVQNLYINTMGVEAGILALFDWPKEVEAHFAALNDSHDRLIDVINDSPVEIVNFGDNVHSATLSPDLFRRYVLPAYQRRCEKLHAGGKFICAHWDGDCGPLLPFARETGLDGIEAITPAPQGDVTLEKVKAGLGDEMFLIDGIPAIYFDETFDEQTLIDCTKKVIDLFAPKLILGISDEISSTGDIERVRTVGAIVDEHNAAIG